MWKNNPNPQPPLVILYIKKFFCHLDDQISHLSKSSQNVKWNFQKGCNNPVKHAFICPALSWDCSDSSPVCRASELTGWTSALLGGGNTAPIIMGKLNSWHPGFQGAGFSFWIVKNSSGFVGSDFVWAVTAALARVCHVLWGGRKGDLGVLLTDLFMPINN